MPSADHAFAPWDARSRLGSPPPSPATTTPAASAEYVGLDRRAENTDDADEPAVVRAQHFVLEHLSVAEGDVLHRAGQADEYVLLVPDAGTRLRLSADGRQERVDRPSIVVMPPGDSEVLVRSPGRLVRLMTVSSAPDLVERSANRDGYRSPKANVAPYQPWPDPVGGHRIRVYDLDVPGEPGRFGRIWRCSTFMVNVLDPHQGPRDPHRLSPHAHADFEQCSLALSGEFAHHLRWPWASDRTVWRDDVHLYAPAPSATIIPPPVVHTTEAIGPGTNQLVDIFCPPRLDFSQVDGWVLNAREYPVPGTVTDDDG
ncbi:MAG: hypothetical protein ACRCZD_17705 [Phycicoccus sp.]